MVAVEMDYLRRAYRVSRLGHVPNQRIRQKISVKDIVNNHIKQRQLIWYEHANGMGEERAPKESLSTHQSTEEEDDQG